MNKKLFWVLIFILCGLQSSAFAADKSWNGGGDESDWFDEDNWLGSVVPTSADDAVVDQASSSVTINKDFTAKSITLGTKRASVISVNNFVGGTVKPAETSDTALLIGRNGHLVLKGTAGTVKLESGYKDSETELPEEPTFMFYAQ